LTEAHSPACVGRRPYLSLSRIRGIYVAGKFAKVFKTSPELAMDFMEFAVLMHDVGKADAAYEASAEYFPYMRRTLQTSPTR
jgi:CRISPR/Cas system-associated endonuclease Cas3-HD